MVVHRIGYGYRGGRKAHPDTTTTQPITMTSALRRAVNIAPPEDDERHGEADRAVDEQ